MLRLFVSPFSRQTPQESALRRILDRHSHQSFIIKLLEFPATVYIQLNLPFSYLKVL